MPRDVWRYGVTVHHIAGLSTPARLARVGLPTRAVPHPVARLPGDRRPASGVVGRLRRRAVPLGVTAADRCLCVSRPGAALAEPRPVHRRCASTSHPHRRAAGAPDRPARGALEAPRRVADGGSRLLTRDSLRRAGRARCSCGPRRRPDRSPPRAATSPTCHGGSPTRAAGSARRATAPTTGAARAAAGCSGQAEPPQVADRRSRVDKARASR